MTTQNVLDLGTNGASLKRSNIRVGFPMYTDTGEVSAPKVWAKTVSTNASGLATIDISSASFSSIISVQCTALRNGAGVTTLPMVGLTSVSTTSLSILTVESKNTPVLIGGNVEGLEISPSCTVYVTVIGT